MKAEDITIAVTVYDRRTYLLDAIASAVGQAIPVRVIVVEDCGPDPGMETFVKEQFGEAVTYFRNSRRHGLFGNWNVCLQLCETRWLSILHDDDLLDPAFVSRMIAVHARLPGRALYCGRTRIVDRHGRTTDALPADWEDESELELALEDLVYHNPTAFPGQLMNVEAARLIGGFRSASQFCGDWEMWFRLAKQGGAVKTNAWISSARDHATLNRGTTRVERNGRRFAYMFTQAKRNFAAFSPTPINQFDRRAVFAGGPMPTRYVFVHAHQFSRWILRYNLRLLSTSPAPDFAYRARRCIALLLGDNLLPLISRLICRFGQLRLRCKDKVAPLWP